VARIHGKDATLSINGVLINGVSYDWTQERDYADITVYGDLGKQFAAGVPAFSGSFEGIPDLPGDSTLSIPLTKVPIILSSGAHGGPIAAGDAFVDVGGSASVTDAVRIRGTIKGLGAWTLG
jgi:hypothetical protein